ncbi:MAG: S8 family serine peptidase, partial [Candidatus Uhrbacteria bacterium]|nr:S8 family serine peptidase [Candidatus Uhrbacteria bacterium]
DVIVAVLDTGVDLDHPDLAANIWTNPWEIASNGKDDDKNGFIDDVHGWDFVQTDNDTSPTLRSDSTIDVLSHGTVISGLIAGVGNNDIGIAGLGWNVRIMPVRMLSINGSGNEQDAADAIDYAVNNGADVINLSFAGNQADALLTNAVQRAYEANVVVVAALGNDARDTNAVPVYPACLKSSVDDWVIGVASSDVDDYASGFSNYGSSCADVSAPGEDIFGPMFENISEGYTDEYMGGWTGTSVASPLVAGTAALLLSAYPSLSPDDVRTLIKLSVDPVFATGSKAGQFGAGRLNVARALHLAVDYAAANPEVNAPDPEHDMIEVETSVGDDEVSADEDTPIEAEPDATPPADAQKSSELLSSSFIVFGAPTGVLPMISVSRADGTSYASFQAYTSNFRGGVNLALADMNGDGIPEVVSGAGESGGPHVRIFKAYGAVIDEFFAYDMASSHGVDVAVGDV